MKIIEPDISKLLSQRLKRIEELEKENELLKEANYDLRQALDYAHESLINKYKPHYEVLKNNCVQQIMDIQDARENGFVRIIVN